MTEVGPSAVCLVVVTVVPLSDTPARETPI